MEPIEPGKRKPIEPGGGKPVEAWCDRKPIEAWCKSLSEREVTWSDKPTAESGTAEASTYHSTAESGTAEASTHHPTAESGTAKASTHHPTAEAAAPHSAAEATTPVKAPTKAAAAEAPAPLGIRCRRRCHHAREGDGGQHDYEPTNHDVSSICQRDCGLDPNTLSSIVVALRPRYDG
jgi:hypothetical protein